jgi:hypothetical protein
MLMLLMLSMWVEQRRYHSSEKLSEIYGIGFPLLRSQHQVGNESTVRIVQLRFNETLDPGLLQEIVLFPSQAVGALGSRRFPSSGLARQ